MFISFVGERCSILNNKTELLAELTQRKTTFKSVSTIDFLNGDALKIVRNLGPNNGHGHNMVCIKMMKTCDDSICKPLKLKKENKTESISGSILNTINDFLNSGKQKAVLNCQFFPWTRGASRVLT